jgi:3-hydroxyacyl-CoA dehydrogenase/enoyl-CoA hydratase/3-hydroxybutyryl-CoA epimerase/enoyl-CoA isomerase
MLYQGQALTLAKLTDSIYQLDFNLADSSVNKLNQLTLNELDQAIKQLTAEQPAGLLISSSKDSFIVGADITEFLDLFARPETDILAMLTRVNQLFCQIEDLPCPTVSCINGLALGGGFELCLATDYRVLTKTSQVGLPEVKLGLYPGFGGTVRLSRLLGVDNALEWICTGKQQSASQALKQGAIDAVVATDKLIAAGIDLLQQAAAGKLDYPGQRQQKIAPIKLPPMENLIAFEAAKGYIKAKAGPHYPAPLAALKTIQQHASQARDKALAMEAQGFVKLSQTPVARYLVGLFLYDQALKRKNKQFISQAKEITQTAVLGAGVMGGGIAYQSASRGIPIVLKDIQPEALQRGLAEASQLLNKQVDRGRLTAHQALEANSRIHASLSYSDFNSVDLVVEAVVENAKVKQQVLAEVEQQIGEHTILTSNTSTIAIDQLASQLERPENFCGMHFFNPVHRMPLVEVVRGQQTSDRAIASTVAYAQALGKKPLVVKDCAGFFVNRVLFPYFLGFMYLLNEGVDYQQIDQAMADFGWPMGPAHLLDVVGLDIARHAYQVLAVAYPERMAYQPDNIVDLLVNTGRLGQKIGRGFYRYNQDQRGRLVKAADPELTPILAQLTSSQQQLENEVIIQRLMIPLCLEVVRCLEEQIIASPAEAELGLIYGIGFPPFRGGAISYLESIGLKEFCQLCQQYQHLGPLYQPTSKLINMANQGEVFFTQQPSKEAQA